MRIFKTGRRPRFTFTLLAILSCVPLFAQISQGQNAADIPVYLKLDSRFPSGVHPRDWLESHTKESQVQRWFRVVVDGSFGWIAEDHVLTSIRLSSIARMNRDEPDRSMPTLDSLRSRRIPKGAQVIVLEVAGSWSRARVLGEDAPSQDSWILNEALIRDPGNQIERGLTFRETQLRHLPKKEAKSFDRLTAFREISVLNSVTNSAGGWIEVSVDSGSAWIERSNVWLPQDLKDGSLRAMRPGLELRSSPLPNANIVRHLTGTEILKVVNSKYLRWGRVKVPEHGWLWWPISDDRLDGPDAIPPLKLSTQELLSRAIYDMASSSAIPGLRFASAGGLFKSRDGIEWSLVPGFAAGNYPISIAKNGTLFVGPYVSQDNGVKFEQWIRWDRLVEAIKRTTGSPPARMRISGIESTDAEGQVVDLIIDVGRSKPVRISTGDRGLSWKLF